jgi:hypothetical protein
MISYTESVYANSDKVNYRTGIIFYAVPVILYRYCLLTEKKFKKYRTCTSK